MKTPPRLIPLLQADLIEEVLGQLQSGKEADIFLVVANGVTCCAKIYKEANNRSFKQKTSYTEGRKTRNSRQGRAMGRNSKYGAQERESEWQNTEVETLYLLSAAGLLVPKPLTFYEGVLLLELVTDPSGNPAPRLHDVELSGEQARAYHKVLIRQVVRMLCAGIVHGDLSEYNILVSRDGLVIIDLPQAVQATANNAFAIFERDLVQLANFFGRAAPELRETQYGKEIWHRYKRGTLKPDTEFTGQYMDTSRRAVVREVLTEIDDARKDAAFKPRRRR